MEFTTWLSLFSICLLGAISPGPSAAIIIQTSTRQGRTSGLLAAVGHGIGIGCYALLATFGLVAMMAEHPNLLNVIKITGALFLIYLGVRSLGWFRFNEAQADQTETLTSQHSLNSLGSFNTGFLIAFLNPKVGLFFLALFSQFVQPNSPITSKLIMTATAVSVDVGWYVLLALAVSQVSILQYLQRHHHFVDRTSGLLLIALALTILFSQI